MKFSLATLHVKDMTKSLEFYNILLGIPIIRRLPMGADKELIFLGVEGEPNLELVPFDGNVTYAGFSVGFEVDNLSQAKDHLARNGYPVKREYAPNPSTTLCFLDGPNGEEVELIEYK